MTKPWLTPKEVTNERCMGRTGPEVLVPLCTCDVHPWEDCEHTADADMDEDCLAHLRSISKPS